MLRIRTYSWIQNIVWWKYISYPTKPDRSSFIHYNLKVCLMSHVYINYRFMMEEFPYASLSFLSDASISSAHARLTPSAPILQ